MTPVRFLIDTSAVVRMVRNSMLRDRWQAQITAGVVAVCPIVQLELLHSSRSKADREEQLQLLGATFAWALMPDRIFMRAAEVQEAMTSRGTHRSAGTVDLLTAAAAELHGVPLIHYDHDFDEVRKVTGQAMVWVASPGTID
ncbi:MAG TPA: PIN domain nuclease [Mycobacteriales bacterium]|nr:PIN domain nuclease [Mycobacteriales bacterium]